MVNILIVNTVEVQHVVVVNFAPVQQITDVKSQHEPGGFF